MNKTSIIVAVVLIGVATLYFYNNGSHDMPDDTGGPSNAAGTTHGGESVPDAENDQIEDEEPTGDVRQSDEIMSPGVPGTEEEIEELKREADHIDEN